jgi:hypothetical protein
MSFIASFTMFSIRDYPRRTSAPSRILLYKTINV